MRREPSGPCLSAVFVDYDNIYLSLKRKNEEIAKRFAKDAAIWIREIESGRLITPTNGPAPIFERRMVMNRCYGNPVPRRNNRDGATDMSSFPFVRHHFLRGGFEIIDCPPLTQQLKNSSDIRMVMDIRDLLGHDTYYDEFVILSGDSDFTPVLHRLRAHARRTVIFANDHTATPYTALYDGEIRELDLIALLAEGRLPADAGADFAPPRVPSAAEQASQGMAITAEVVDMIRAADGPVPIEALADRAQRVLGYEKTIGTSWAGHGAFRTFLLESLPDEIALTDQAPYLAYEVARQPQLDRAPVRDAPVAMMPPATEVLAPAPAPTVGEVEVIRPGPEPVLNAEMPGSAESGLQNSIARIHEACQAPPLAPPEYLKLFAAMAAEINENALSGAQTITNIAARARQQGLDAKRDDIRFILDVVSEADPWFEQGASANLFAGRFRNFVVARCRSQGLKLAPEELDLIDAWFAGATAALKPIEGPVKPAATVDEDQHDSWWSSQDRTSTSTTDQADPAVPALSAAGPQEDLAGDFGPLPRIMRSRLDG